MQQLTYVKKRVLEWREAPEPALRSPQEAIVRPFAAARCDMRQTGLSITAKATEYKRSAPVLRWSRPVPTAIRKFSQPPSLPKP